MASLSFTAANIRPLDGAVTRGFNAGAASITPGDLVYIASDGDVELADGNGAQALARAVGIVTAIQGGKASTAAGDRVTVVLFGPVAGFASLTPGANGYLSDTAGDIADAVATYDRIVGFAESATVFFVSIQQNDPSSA